MPLPPNEFLGLDDEKLSAAVREFHAKGFCYVPFPTVGQGVIPVPVWPPAIPMGWPPLRRAFGFAFMDAYGAAARICSGQPRCPNVELLNPPPLIIRFFRERLFTPPPNPVPVFPFNFLICVVVAFWRCVEEDIAPPPVPMLPDDIPDIEDFTPLHFASNV
jgi:hypothetical protein